MQTISDGVRNLVNQCAEVASGERVLVLNEVGKMDPAVADHIAAAVRERGADGQVLWQEPTPRDATDLPKPLLDAILAADKVIFNYSVNRVVLDGYTRGRAITQIHNGCRTTAQMQSPHATYHWGMVKTIYGRLEELFAAAEGWRVTSPAGTTISGTIGRATDIADAYFAQEAEGLRSIRVFPGEVYTPVGCVGASGTIVVEYINNKDTMPWDDPVTLTVADNRIVAITGSGEHRRQLESSIERQVQQHGDKARIVDSWHGGMNPMARVPTTENRSLAGAGSSPAMMHFHLGRQLDPISAGNLYPTVEADGRKILEGGKLLVLDDPKIQAAAERHGVAAMARP